MACAQCLQHALNGDSMFCAAFAIDIVNPASPERTTPQIPHSARVSYLIPFVSHILLLCVYSWSKQLQTLRERHIPASARLLTMPPMCRPRLSRPVCQIIQPHKRGQNRRAEFGVCGSMDHRAVPAVCAAVLCYSCCVPLLVQLPGIHAAWCCVGNGRSGCVRHAHDDHTLHAQDGIHGSWLVYLPAGSIVQGKEAHFRFDLSIILFI